jgi:hypothetical protein
MLVYILCIGVSICNIDIKKKTNVCLRPPNDSQSDFRTNIPDSFQSGIHKTRSVLIRLQRSRESNGRVLHHSVSDVPGFTEDAAHADPGEDVHVVPLTRLVCFPLVLHRLVRTSGSEDNLSIGPVRR